MSDYQVTNFGMCGECRFHTLETRQYPNKRGQITCSAQVRCEWVCANPKSDYYADYTDFTDTCECFEQRGIE